MSYIMSMLEAASSREARDRSAFEIGRAKRRATLEQKKWDKWGAAFKEHGGKASTNVLAGYMGRAPASILKSMQDLEELGWVRRAGIISKAGPGKAQIIWEWAP